MKTSFRLLASLIFVSTSFSSAFADSKLLITKGSGGGYVPQEWFRYEQCSIYNDKVVIKHTLGGTSTAGAVVTETHAITVDGNIEATIQAAYTDTIESTDNNLCDAPETQINGYAKDSAGGADKAFVLFASGGCGSPRLSRSSAAANILIDIAALYCPKTFDGIGNGFRR